MVYHRNLQRIEPPEGGWKQLTFYVVEACFGYNNPICQYVFYTGFLDKGYPSGYNEFCEIEGHPPIQSALYVKALKELWTKEAGDFKMYRDLPQEVRK